MRLDAIGEFGLIDRIAALVTGGTTPQAGQVTLGIGDDAALLEISPDRSLVSTIDTLVEEVHFRRDWTGPEDLGWKALAVNVSDVAAMGAEPLAAFLSLALPGEIEVEWVEAFTHGMADCAREYGCVIAGGDTVRSPKYVVITVSLLGTVERGRALLRSGARVGDLLCVTGTLGDSAAGLALLMAGDLEIAPSKEAARPEFASLLTAHRRPRPRLQVARRLATFGAITAMMDLSDGLASDVRHLAARSGVGVRVRRADLPLSEAARAAGAALGIDPADWALHGGEDYELLFTVAPSALDSVRVQLLSSDLPFTVVGEIVEDGIWLVEADGLQVTLKPGGFAHFRSTEGGSSGA